MVWRGKIQAMLAMTLAYYSSPIKHSNTSEVSIFLSTNLYIQSSLVRQFQKKKKEVQSDSYCSICKKNPRIFITFPDN